MLQGPRHSSLLHRYKGCPIYREQSAIAMEPWAQPAGSGAHGVHPTAANTSHTHTDTV